MLGRFVFAVLSILVAATGVSPARAQHVGMAGEYSEAHGIFVHLPMNPPVVDCAADSAAWTASPFARCPRLAQHFFGTTAAPPRFRAPERGAHGARLGTAAAATLPGVATPGTRPAGLNVGDPFRIPPGLIRQQRGLQSDIVFNNALREIRTRFTVSMPAAARAKAPPPNTRVFQANGWVGQDDGATSPVVRTAATQTLMHTVDADVLTLTYAPGPNAFGGTMAALLEGSGRGFAVRDFGTAGSAPFSLLPLVASAPLPTNPPPFEQAGPGWNYTAMAAAAPGYGKGFGIYSQPTILEIVAPSCTGLSPPATPPGCNKINFWSTPHPVAASTGQNPEAISLFNGAPGVHLGFVIPGATSTRHAFAWTTGEVRIRRVTTTVGITLTDTVTGRGYDTISTGPGGTLLRNVGLVAGSYVVRTPASGDRRIGLRMAGIDLRFSPEPGMTAGLLTGLLLLCRQARRRTSERHA